MFNLLVDDLPTFMSVGGTDYSINWDTNTLIRISILFENNSTITAHEDKTLELALQPLELFYQKMPDDLEEAMVKLIEFYTHTPTNNKIQRRDSNSVFDKRSYSFQYDSNMIYAAFLQQYPTKSIKNLHWFEFKAMLESLTEACLFVKVTQWRAMKINKDMPKQDKQFYRRMKKLYALPDNRPQEQKDKDFASMLFFL